MRTGFLVQALIATLLGFSSALNINPPTATEHQAIERDNSNLDTSVAHNIHRPDEASLPTSTFTVIPTARAGTRSYKRLHEKDARNEDAISRNVDKVQDGHLAADDVHPKSARTDHGDRHHMERRHGPARRKLKREALGDLNPAPHKDISDAEILEDGSVRVRGTTYVEQPSCPPGKHCFTDGQLAGIVVGPICGAVFLLLVIASFAACKAWHTIWDH
ncbi:hypothetical protein QBC45DRAFT_381229 [Copromyces sp. CBS 386.78]|nr:hypothetical protein QBC45DRAFT_381229 [Copromyces sp. CBS 386.78]